VVALKSISASLGFDRLFASIRHLGSEHVWLTTDAWLYMTIAAQEASASLENEVAKAPASLNEVRYLAIEWLEEQSEQRWRGGVLHEPADMVGRLSVCDRIARIAEVLDSLERFRLIMEQAANEPSFNAVEAVLQEFGLFAQHMERCETRHDAILGEVPGTTFC
jgi:hypothetical protein